ncbi:MAG TPA: carbohydrate ABC transporter permease, partial [Anaerolineae bacterium]|nr:carbohydrate ABC transporter permease [Anaerolineae bacterium]
MAQKRTQQFLVWSVLIITTFIALFPMYWLFVNSLTPMIGTPPLTPILIPAFSLDNFARLLGGTRNYTDWMRNSLTVSIVVTLWHIVFDTMAGYAFAKRQFPLKNVMFWIILSTLMIPVQVTLIPLYVVARQFGLIDNLLSLILPGTAAAFGIFLMRQYIQTLPTELEDAARIDGAGEFRVFWEIILPMCKPAIAALAIFTFVRNWNDFLWPVIALNRPQ